jgi:hypothetical protein
MTEHTYGNIKNKKVYRMICSNDESPKMTLWYIPTKPPNNDNYIDIFNDDPSDRHHIFIIHTILLFYFVWWFGVRQHHIKLCWFLLCSIHVQCVTGRIHVSITVGDDDEQRCHLLCVDVWWLFYSLAPAHSPSASLSPRRGSRRQSFQVQVQSIILGGRWALQSITCILRGRWALQSIIL